MSREISPSPFAHTVFHIRKPSASVTPELTRTEPERLVGCTVPDARAVTVWVAENEDRVTWGVNETEDEAEGEGLMECVAVRERDTVLGGEGVAVIVPSPVPLALGE